MAAGLASAGVDVLDAGVIPTPATAYLIADENADFGVMISASHNPAADNGIKFFAAGGRKLPDELENRIEAALGVPALTPTGADVGRIRRFSDAEDRYVLHLLGSLEGSGWMVCTSSSTARTAPPPASRPRSSPTQEPSSP